MFTAYRLSILAALLTIAGLANSGLTMAAELRPDQRAAVEKMLARMEPAKREAARAHLEQSVAGMSPALITLMVNNLDAKPAAARSAPASPPPKKRQATAEDLAYNRAQYEPAIRRNWRLQREFNELLDAQFAAHCPGRDKYAVYDIGVRYELRELGSDWFRGTDNADIDVSIYEGGNAPKDGRYDFDFSNARVSFNKQKVTSAVATACADWSREAAAFHEKASAFMKAGQNAAAAQAERAGNARIEPIAKALQAVIEAESPSPDLALHDALANPKPVG